MNQKTKIIISRTDSIGDVVLTLPLVSFLKKEKKKAGEDVEIYFLGRNYTKDVILSCSDVDEFISYDDNYSERLKEINADCFIHVFPRKDIAKKVKKLKIPLIIGTMNRIYHWGKCHRLIKFSRKKSHLHEAQLNFHLLKPLFTHRDDLIPEVNELTEVLEFSPKSQKKIYNDGMKKRVLFHPMSNGSAVDWPLEKFRKLGKILIQSGYSIGITGTEKEGLFLRDFFTEEFNNGIFEDLTGKFNLKELIEYISQSYALIASSTGPLHLAGVTGINTIGLFSQVRPIHAGRWSPIGSSIYIVEAQDKNTQPSISTIEVSEVKKVLDCIELNQ